MSRALALVDSSDESRQFDNAPSRAGLLETKLYAPRTRGDLVARQRLIDSLRDAATQKLTLVTAPAGLWVGKQAATATSELSVTQTQPGQPPSVTLPIAQAAAPAAKPRASDATELVDFVPVKADGAPPAPKPAPATALQPEAQATSRSARSAVLVLLLLAVAALVLWRLVVH